jgi:hypothetical protein
MTRRWGAVFVVLALCSCVGPARSFDDYEGKAADTADSVVSAVGTARLAVQAAADGRAFAPYLSVVLAETEGDVRASIDTFGSIQPPDARSDALRTELLDLTDRAVAVLSQLRIRVRWGDLAALPEVARPLDGLGSELTVFSEAHS